MSTAVLDLETSPIADFLSGKGERAILLTGVSWEEYESFLKQNWEKNNLSFAYDNGVLEIMSKSPKHEDYSRTIYNFVLAYCEHIGVFLEGRGSATFKRSVFKKGVEPDECFYVQNAETVIGLDDWDAETYPAPDVAVEIDLTTESLDKFPIYAALQVAELWIFDGGEVKFYRLENNRYHPTETSQAFSGLSADLLNEFIKISRTKGQTLTLREFRDRLREQKSK
jgi:Uma2 family endonuclease